MSHRTHRGPLVAQHTERAFAEPAFWACYALFALLVLIALAGCVTSASLERTLPDGGKIAASYFSTKAQKWVLGVDPASHLPTVSVNADTPTGWSGQDAGSFAQGILTGAGSAIGAGISAAAGKPPTPPIVVRPPRPAPPPDPGDGGDNGGNSLAPRSPLQRFLESRTPPAMLESPEP